MVDFVNLKLAKDKKENFFLKKKFEIINRNFSKTMV